MVRSFLLPTNIVDCLLNKLKKLFDILNSKQKTNKQRYSTAQWFDLTLFFLLMMKHLVLFKDKDGTADGRWGVPGFHHLRRYCHSEDDADGTIDCILPLH